MASQVQIPFEGVILQEHSAPISCPTPNFAKGSYVRLWSSLDTMIAGTDSVRIIPRTTDPNEKNQAD